MLTIGIYPNYYFTLHFYSIFNSYPPPILWPLSKTNWHDSMKNNNITKTLYT